jgi:hypothetical protein
MKVMRAHGIWIIFALSALIVLAGCGGGAPKGGMSAKEFYDFSLKKAQEKQGDVFLTLLATAVPYELDEKGKTANWTAVYYSPSSKNGYSITLIDGKEFVSEVPNMPWDFGTPEKITDSMLNAPKLYAMAIEEMGSNYNKDTDAIGVQIIPYGEKYSWNIYCVEKANPKNNKWNKRIAAGTL